MQRLTPTRVEIHLRALKDNWKKLVGALPTGHAPMAVVKSNAYGHGAALVAKALEEEGAGWFGVGTVDEGIELRRAGITGEILILLGLVQDSLEDLLHYRLTPVLYDTKVAQHLNQGLTKKGETLPVHIKVDTGMTRLGVLPHEAQVFFKTLRDCSHLQVKGLLSHLADAEDNEYTSHQIETFRKILQEADRQGFSIQWRHIANSLLGIRGDPEGFNLVRFGIALYGGLPALQPVMHWKTKIVALKTVPKGTPVSYGRTFTTSQASTLAILPVGYADGYFRSLSNKGFVLVHEKRIPIVGRICMDMMLIDVTGLPGVAVGDEVVLLGQQGHETLRAEELAKLIGTISYEIFTSVASRLSRIPLG